MIIMNFFVQYYPGIIALCKMYKVKRLFAFGSVLTNRFTDKSDIDLVVDFDKEKVDDYFSNFFDLKYALEKLLGRKVDFFYITHISCKWIFRRWSKKVALIRK